MQCDDNSDLLALLANSIGLPATLLYIDDGNGHELSSLLYAEALSAGDTSAKTGDFKWHQIVSFGGKVYDPCLAEAPESFYAGMLFPAYNAALFPTENTLVTSPVSVQVK